MIDEAVIQLIKDVGFPMAIAVILLWDKMRTNGSLLRVVENNNVILRQIERRIK